MKLREDGTNYPAWEACFLNACIAKEVGHTIVKPSPFTKANAAATSLLSSSIPEIWINHVTSLPTVHEGFAWIRSKYRGGYNSAVNAAWTKQLQDLHMTREETLESYISRAESLYGNLQANGRHMEREEIVGYIIKGLPADFELCRASLLVTCMSQEFLGVLRTLVQVANSLGFNDQIPRLPPRAAISRLPPNSSDRHRGRRNFNLANVDCWTCGEKGHMRRDCPQQSTQDRLGATGATQHSTPNQRESGSISWISHNVFHYQHQPSEDWIIDSGASVHVVNSIELLHNATVYSEPQVLHLATTDGQGDIVAEGNVCIRDTQGRELWLRHVKCVPGASTNLVSVSAGLKDGVTFVPRENGSYCAMSGPQGWECKVVEKQGLYVISGTHPN